MDEHSLRIYCVLEHMKQVSECVRLSSSPREPFLLLLIISQIDSTRNQLNVSQALNITPVGQAAQAKDFVVFCHGLPIT